MGNLNIAASTPGWATSINSVRALPREVKTAISRKGRNLAEPLARELRAAGVADGSHAARVAERVRSSMKAGAPSITASGLPYVMGSEYGGGVRRTTYYSTSPRGKRFLVVARHTTRQFRTFRGSRGYWWNPTLFEDGNGREAVLQAWADLVDEVIASW